MATHLPGPSSHGRVAACLASEVLPHTQENFEAARRGAIIHAFMSACLHGEGEGFEERRAGALRAVPKEYRAACEMIDLSRLPPLNPRAATAELSLGYNIRTGQARVLGANLEREEVRRLADPEEVVGTSDWAALTPYAFISLDWKTGYRDVDPAEINMQFRTYGLLGARAYGRDSAIVGGVRILADGGVWYDVVEMDALDLSIHESAMLALMEQRQDAINSYQATSILPKQVQGSHCTFCPAFAFCPAKAALLRAALPGESGVPDISRQAPSMLDARAVGHLFTQISMAEEVLERMKTRLKDWVRANGPAPLENGYTLRKEETVSMKLRGELAEAILLERLGEAFVKSLAKREVKITREALKEHVAEHLDAVWQHLLDVGQVTPEVRRSVAAAERALVDELGIAGAVEYTPTSRVDAYRDTPARKPRVALPRGQGEET